MYVRTLKIKNKDGSLREYLQIVECKWDPQKKYPKQKLLLNLARVDKMDSSKRAELERIALQILKVLGKEVHLKESFEIKKVGKPLFWGLANLIFSSARFIGLEEELKKVERERRTEFSFSKAIIAMIAGRLHGRLTEASVGRWVSSVYGTGIESLSTHHLYRAMDVLEEEWGRIERALKWRVMDLFTQRADILFVDTTTLIYWGEGEEGLTERGFSKEKRSDKRQVLIGIAMMKGLPVGIEIEGGKSSDVRVMKKMLERFRERFRIGEVCIVADSALVPVKDLGELEGWGYILGARLSEKIVKEKVKEARGEGGWEEVGEGLWAKGSEVKRKDGKKERLIVVRNEEMERYEKGVREEILKKLSEMEGKGIKEVVSNKGYRRYLSTSERVKIDWKKVESASLWDGIWVIRTNISSESLKEVVERYKELWQVEGAFKELKDLVSARPIYHWRGRRIKSHIRICFLTLLISMLLRKEIRGMGFEEPFEEAMEGLKGLRVDWIEVKGKRFALRDELTEWQKKLFKRFGMKIPPAVLESL